MSERLKEWRGLKVTKVATVDTLQEALKIARDGLPEGSKVYYTEEGSDELIDVTSEQES